MKYKHSSTLFLLLLLLLVQTIIYFQFADAGKRRVHITNDLDDVVDNEEDDAWIEWGKKKSSPDSDLPDIDFSQQTDFTKIQSDMMKYQTGPAFGFVKLRLGQRRKPVSIRPLLYLHIICILVFFFF